MGWGVLIDISKYNELPITMSSIKNQHLVKKDDFVFFKTGWSKYIKKEIYFDYPELSFEILEWLTKKRVNMIGIDALGLSSSKNH